MPRTVVVIGASAGLGRAIAREFGARGDRVALLARGADGLAGAAAQLGWVRSRLPKDAQPVPPIYQPEVGARAVAYAADHPKRREYWVGGSTVGTLVGNALAPGILDRC